MKPIPEYTDFVAEVTYFTTDEGGRCGYAASGYRPHIKFSFSKYLTSGQQTFLDKEIVHPGETVTTAIKILSVNIFHQSLSEGMIFEVGEGPRTVGTGKITEIINENLRYPF
jgi:translation elongation factor EF-Tu-like GTPase